MSGEKAPTEGWGVLIPGERRHHYYVDGASVRRNQGASEDLARAALKLMAAVDVAGRGNR